MERQLRIEDLLVDLIEHERCRRFGFTKIGKVLENRSSVLDVFELENKKSLESHVNSNKVIRVVV